jgi:phospholipid/cholesterol/gamma-HCH transport system substrate-binding protein
MQVNRAEKVRLGIFVALALTVIAVSVFYLVGKRLVTKEDAYCIKFSESVDGLMAGANVKLNGVSVGRVKDISVDSMDVRKVIVYLVVKHGTPIKQDMVANLSGGLSITGIKTVQLSGGTYSAANIPVGGEITAGVSQFKMLTGQAEEIALKFETLLNNFLAVTDDEHQALVSNLLKSIYSLSRGMDTLVRENAATATKISQHGLAAIRQFQITANRTDSLIRDIQQSRPGYKLGKTIDEFQAGGVEFRKKIKEIDAGKTLKSFEKTASTLTSAASKMDNTLTLIQEDLGATMRNIKETTENMAEFSRLIKDNPSLLLRTGEKEERAR